MYELEVQKLHLKQTSRTKLLGSSQQWTDREYRVTQGLDGKVCEKPRQHRCPAQFSLLHEGTFF